MAEPMTVHVEVWPVAADEVGIWLVSGNDAWRPREHMAVEADSEPHWEIDSILRNNDVLDNVVMKHSTSWRVDRYGIVLTYVAILKPSGLVREMWPDARPIGLGLARAVGKPPPSPPIEPPTPRYIDVLLHALRHLRFLIDTDAVNRAAMGNVWQHQLAGLAPALSTMYEADNAESQA